MSDTGRVSHSDARKGAPVAYLGPNIEVFTNIRFCGKLFAVTVYLKRMGE